MASAGADVSAALEAVGEGEGDRGCRQAENTASNAAEIASGAYLAEQGEAISNAAEFSAAHPSDQDDSTKSNIRRSTAAEKRGIIRPDGAKRAEQVVAAIADYAKQKRIPAFAVVIDHARIAKLLGSEHNANERTVRNQVFRGIRYAEELGMLVVHDSGRPRPNRKIDGVPGLYSIIATEVPGGRRVLTERERAALVDVATSKIRANKRTRRRVDSHWSRLDTFDAVYGDTRQRVSERESKKARERTEARQQQQQTVTKEGSEDNADQPLENW
ncbi:MAG TPA: hypothetical protein VMA98_01640 [Candidatus Acidoferrales bacterium]|nr:hypothetical protein [Candidatus Acidoferrales bacterium]